MTAGEQITLEASVEPEGASQAVTWSSSDDAIASVADGVVTGVSAGSATISATSDAKPAVSGTLSLTVEAAASATVFIFTPAPAKMNIDSTTVNSESNLSIILLEVSDPLGNAPVSKVIAQPSTTPGRDWDVLYCESDGQWNQQGPSNNEGESPAFEGGQLKIFAGFERPTDAGEFTLGVDIQEAPLTLNYTLDGTLDGTLTAVADGDSCN